jgi:hypothetical protein
MAQVNISMIQAGKLPPHSPIKPDPRKWGAIGFYLVYDHHVPKYGELPAAARDFLGVKEIGKHLESHVIWQS